jgi:phosphoserine aminotransferase
VEKPNRSRINATFRIGSAEGNAELEQKFVSEAALQNMISLKGHR